MSYDLLSAYLTPEQFYYLSGLAGIACAFLVGIIWSRGL